MAVPSSNGVPQGRSAAALDQSASDRERSPGGDAHLRCLTPDLRDRSAAERRRNARSRVDAAAARDETAHARDLAALDRDRLAAIHDRELAGRDAARAADASPAPSSFELVVRAAEQRSRAAADRASAAEARARAAADREHAARDREHAARDRLQSQADRESLLAQLALAETDPLTGARTRAAGLADLDHEIDRAQRTGGLLSIAYVDVVGLKAVNDTEGHAAGDALLSTVVAVVRSHLRSYDLVIRLGGDEFLCAMPEMALDEARSRFAGVSAALNTQEGARGIRTGFADVMAGESAPELIARADRELLGRGSR